MCKEVMEGCGSGRHRLQVLVGDDDLAGSIVHWSAHAGLEVDAVESGTQAARLLRNHRYRALVTDRVIPPWPGLNSLPKLKRQFPDLRVIVFLRRGSVGAGSLLRQRVLTMSLKDPYAARVNVRPTP